MARRRAERTVLARESPPELKVARAEGNFVFDAAGNRYLDFTMGWCVGNLGWGHPAIAKAMLRFDGPDYVHPDYAYEPWRELAELLASIAPGKLTKCFRATGGSEAVDLALQAAMLHTGRRKFLAVAEAYHGNTIATLSLTPSAGGGEYPNRLPNCHEIAPPLAAKALAKVERRLACREYAAFIMEPISINLGVLIPDAEFMHGLQRACRRYGTLLVMDEVATGFGRTGTLFASEQFGLEPDILCVAKAITNGAGALGATIMRPAVAASMEEDGSFYSTYGWHPRSVHAAIATVSYLIEHRRRVLGNVAVLGAYCRERLAQMQFRKEATVRSRGLAIGIDVGDDGYADRIATRCRRAGLLLSTEGPTLLLLPALEIDRATAAAGLDILEQNV